MATNNINTNSFASTNDNSKEDSAMEDIRRTIRSLQDELEKFMVVEPGQEVSDDITITVNGKTFELYNDAAFVDGLHRALQDFVENL